MDFSVLQELPHTLVQSVAGDKIKIKNISATQSLPELYYRHPLGQYRGEAPFISLYISRC